MQRQKIHFVDGPQQTGLPISSVVETTPEVIAEPASSLMEKGERSRLPLAEEIELIYPHTVLDPKVYAEYEPAEGNMPRRIIVERKKRKIAGMDIEEMLRDLGIDYSVPPDKNKISSFLKLE
jgi:hypothetical protein